MLTARRSHVLVGPCGRSGHGVIVAAPLPGKKHAAQPVRRGKGLIVGAGPTDRSTLAPVVPCRRRARARGGLRTNRCRARPWRAASSRARRSEEIFHPAATSQRLAARPGLNVAPRARDHARGRDRRLFVAHEVTYMVLTRSGPPRASTRTATADAPSPRGLTTWTHSPPPKSGDRWPGSRPASSRT
jgi:hypothetical protein